MKKDDLFELFGDLVSKGVLSGYTHSDNGYITFTVGKTGKTYLIRGNWLGFYLRTNCGVIICFDSLFVVHEAELEIKYCGMQVAGIPLI